MICPIRVICQQHLLAERLHEEVKFVLIYHVTWKYKNTCTRSHKCTKRKSLCVLIFSLSAHTNTALLLESCLSVGAWTNVPSAPAPDTQSAFIPNEGLMNFLKGGDGLNWSWYVPSGCMDGAIGQSLVLLPCDSQTRPKWKNLLALTGQFTVY